MKRADRNDGEEFDEATGDLSRGGLSEGDQSSGTEGLRESRKKANERKTELDGRFGARLAARYGEDKFVVMKDHKGRISFPHTTLKRTESDPESSAQLWDDKFREWAELEMGVELNNASEWVKKFDQDREGFIFFCTITSTAGWTASNTYKDETEFKSTSRVTEQPQRFRLVTAKWMGDLPRNQLRGRR